MTQLRVRQDLVVDVSSDIEVVRDGTVPSLQRGIVPLSAPGHGHLGIEVRLDLIHEMFRYLQGRHTAISAQSSLAGWDSKSVLGMAISTRQDFENRVLWPVIDDITKKVFDAASLHELRRAFGFADGVKCTIMRYPELVALIDGADFRYPDPRFIQDMRPSSTGSIPERDPDWFRSNNDLPILWRGKSCELCGSNQVVVRHIIGPSRIVRCTNCGLEYGNPQAVIDVKWLDKYCSVFDRERKTASSKDRAEQNAKIFVKDLRLLRDESLLKQPLLEIGCASGEFLLSLREKYGWPNSNLTGVEPSEFSSNVARSEYGLTVMNTWAERAELRNKVQIVVILNTIEHLAQPRKVLQSIREHLDPNGRVFIGTVPNVGSLASTLFPEGFIAKNVPDGQHHYQYSPETLEDLCKKEGFDVVATNGRKRDIVGEAKKEAAAWLAYTCGVPPDRCINTDTVLRELKRRIGYAREELAARDRTFVVKASDFDSVDSLISFWRREIWSNPYLSDTFDLWLRPRK